MYHILTVDDEEHILELLNYTLEKEYHVLQAQTGEQCLDLIQKNKVDIILLDYMLPGMDGIAVIRELKSSPKYKDIPIIMLTAKSEEFDTVLSLEMGADDYICKPFAARELLARIRSVLRRCDKAAEMSKTEPELERQEVLEVNGLVIDRNTHQVRVNHKTIELPLKEFELLYLLVKNRGMILDREALLDKIWGYEYYGETRTVDVHIRNLRKKIEKDDRNPVLIKTVRGVGYKFSNSEENR